MIAPWHAEIAEQKLGEKRQVKPQKHRPCRYLPEKLRIKPSGHLRPPKMKPAHQRADHSADHNIVEMSDYEVGIVNVDIDGECRDKEPGEPANGEEAQKPERVNHGRFHIDTPLIKGDRPVENFDRSEERRVGKESTS